MTIRQDSGKIGCSVVFNSVGTFVYFFFQWLTTILVVRLADFEQAGIFSLTISFCNYFCFISLYGVRGFQVTDIENRFSAGQYVGHRILTLVTSLGLFFAVLVILYGEDQYFMLCATAYMLFKILESVTDVLFGEMQRQNHYDWIACSYIAKGFLPVAMLGIILKLQGNLAWAMLGMALSYFVVIALYDYRNLKAVVSLRPVFKGVGPIFKKCFPLMLYSLVLPYITYFTRAGVERVFGTVELGYYGSVSVVVVVMTTLGGAIWGVFLPKIGQMYSDGSIKIISNWLIAMLLCLAFVGIVSVAAAKLIGEWLLALLFGQAIRPYTYLLTPALVASVLLTTSSLFSGILVAMKKNTPMLLAALVGTVVCTATTGSFITRWGMNGASYCMVASFATQVLLMSVIIFVALHQRDRER